MEDVLAIRDEYRLQEWSQIIQAGQNSGLSKQSLTGRLRLSLSLGPVGSRSMKVRIRLW